MMALLGQTPSRLTPKKIVSFFSYLSIYNYIHYIQTQL